MHQSTQRRLCRVVFLVGCILPTLAVMAWATYERLPTTATARLAVVERMLGMRLGAASIDTPLPGVVRCRELELANVETGEVVLTASLAHLYAVDPTPRVRLSGVSLTAAELPHLAASLHRALEVDWPGSIRIELANVSWNNTAKPAAAELLDGRCLTLTLESTEQNGEITGRRCTIETSEGGPRVEVLRNRQVSPPATRIVLNTAGEQVPADWLVSLGALVIDGGETATFTGEAQIVRSAGKTSGTLNGELTDVALAEALNIPLDAVGNVKGLEIDWQDGRILTAEGNLVASTGTMPGALALSLQHLFHELPPGANIANTDTLAFGWLGVKFSLSNQSLSLQPLDGAAQHACILGSDSQVLFGQPTRLVPTPYVGTVLTHFGGDRGVEAAARLPRTLQR